jgi:hypothetical protein
VRRLGRRMRFLGLMKSNERAKLGDKWRRKREKGKNERVEHQRTHHAYLQKAC